MPKAAIAEARAEILRRPDLSGSGRRTALTDVTDTWLAEVFDAAARGVDAPAALVAVGGHGRRELAPGSDLDVMLIHRGDGRQAAKLAEGMWYPIWDARLPLDHSVRTMGEARTIAASDMKALLGLLDLRVLAGDRTLGEHLRTAILADWRAMARRRIGELRELVGIRRSRWGDLSHMLEPDLKEAYGGLREVTVMRGIAASWLTDIPHGEWQNGVEVLLDVRDALHMTTGSRSDVLLLQEQDPVAEALHVRDGDDLLRRVYDAARSVAYVSDHVWQRIDRLTWQPRPSGRRTVVRSGPTRIPLADGVVRHGGEAVLAHDAQPAQDPTLLLRAAAAAANAGVPLAAHTVERLAKESAPLPTPWPRAARESFVALLGSGPMLLHVWEGLDQVGIIDALIPGWAAIRSAPQRNAIHRYTVDRHLIETVLQCQTRDVRRPDLLLIGALLHDFGKTRGGDHSVVGAQLAEPIATTMGFDEGETDAIVTLVRHHLLLPDIATGRDIDDAATIDEVCTIVPNAEHIELLAALSRADALATGPSVSSAWRLGLIANLAGRCIAALDGVDVAREPELSQDEAFLLHHSGLWVTVDEQFDGCVVTVAAPDAPGLLSLVAAVLSARHLQIRSARVSTAGGRALQRWFATPLFGDAPTGTDLHDDVRRALAGHYDPMERLRTRETSVPSRTTEPALVDITHPPQAARTVVEVRAQDRPGLLHQITAAISACQVSIHGAKVDTRGADVVDVFFVTNVRGEPLDEGDATSLRDALLDVLR